MQNTAYLKSWFRSCYVRARVNKRPQIVKNQKRFFEIQNTSLMLISVIISRNKYYESSNESVNAVIQQPNIKGKRTLQRG